MKTDRRGFITAAAAVLAGIPYTGRLFARTPPVLDFNASMQAIVDTVVPRDAYAGALDVGIDEQLIKFIRANAAYLGKMTEALHALNTVAISKFGEVFRQLPLDQRTEILQTILTQKTGNQNLKIQISSLRLKTLNKFYSSEQAFMMLDYHPPSQGGYPDYDRPPGTLMATEYDVVIAGSGAGGGFCAMALARRGVKVLLLERGKRYDYQQDYPMNYPDWELRVNPLSRPHELFDHGPTPDIAAEDHDLCSGRYSDGKLEHSTPQSRQPVRYYRALGVGGSTLHYQGEAHRFSEHAFRPKSLYDWGEDWPLDYAELEPCYQQVENILGVAGTPANPFKPERGTFPTPAHPFSTRTQLVQPGAEKLGLHLLPNSLALPSKSVDGRSPCQHSGGCYQGCIFGAKSSVDMTAIPLGEASGNLTVLEQSRLIRIEHDAKGTISGFIYLKGGQTERANATKYVLALGAIETPRILLASASKNYPDGIGNQTDNVGRHFMETVFASLQCEADVPLHSYKGPPIDARIWDFSRPQKPLKAGFVLGVSGTISNRLSPISYSWGISGLGLNHKQKMRERFGRAIQLFGIADHISDPDNRITLAEKTDRQGVPLVRVYSDYGDEDKRTLKAMLARIEQWADASNLNTRLSLLSSYDTPGISHVGGTCRMGNDPSVSVTNRHGQVHGIANLYITDGSVLPTLGAGDSPSLTIQALAMRTADQIIRSG